MSSLRRVLSSVPWALFLLVGVAGANACPPDLPSAQHIRCLCGEAERGDMSSQILLGFAYFVGIETPQNYEEAAEWFRRAADQGHPDAQFQLGSMYYLGQGVGRNVVISEMWFILSAAQGQDNARQALETTERVVTPAQIAEAQKLAREWKPKPDRSPANRCGSSS